jgi:hypothetical protein
MRGPGFQETKPAVHDVEIFNPDDEHHEYRASLIKFVGAPLVYVSETNENPAVGFGLRIEEDRQLGKPVLVVYDHISEREKRATTMPYPFTNQVFSAVFHLNRNTLIALLHRRNEGKAVFLQPTEKPIDYEHANILLRASGFFNELATFNASR